MKIFLRYSSTTDFKLTISNKNDFTVVKDVYKNKDITELEISLNNKLLSEVNYNFGFISLISDDPITYHIHELKIYV
jgi:hypothetical protein